MADPPGGSDCDFAALFVPLRSAALRFARRLTRGAHESEDLVQEAFLRARAHFHRFRMGSDPRVWLFAIVYNEFASCRRAQARRSQVHFATVTSQAGPPGETHPADRLTPEILEHALSHLPAGQQIVIRLRDLDGRSYLQIAGTLGIPVGTVMSRLNRGRARLRPVLGGLLNLPEARE